MPPGHAGAGLATRGSREKDQRREREARRAAGTTGGCVLPPRLFSQLRTRTGKTAIKSVNVPPSSSAHGCGSQTAAGGTAGRDVRAGLTAAGGSRRWPLVGEEKHMVGPRDAAPPSPTEEGDLPPATEVGALHGASRTQKDTRSTVARTHGACERRVHGDGQWDGGGQGLGGRPSVSRGRVLAWECENVLGTAAVTAAQRCGRAAPHGHDHDAELRAARAPPRFSKSFDVSECSRN